MASVPISVRKFRPSRFRVWVCVCVLEEGARGEREEEVGVSVN